MELENPKPNVRPNGKTKIEMELRTAYIVADIIQNMCFYNSGEMKIYLSDKDAKIIRLFIELLRNATEELEF